MYLFDRIAKSLAEALYWIAGASIVAMTLLTCADVVLRYLRRPIVGTYELVCFFGAMAVAFAMAHTSAEKGHVAVSILVSLFPRKIQGVIESITGIFGLAFFSLIAWQSALYANDLRASGEVSLTLQMPFYPFVYGISISAAATCLVIFSDLLKNLTRVFEK